MSEGIVPPKISEDTLKKEMETSSIATQEAGRGNSKRKSLEKAPGPPPPTPEIATIHHYQSQSVEVVEDFYNTYVDHRGFNHHIKKFTWKNYNKLTVSVINYGARIVVMKAPDKKGKPVDILLGFDELEGNLQNGDFPLGGCLGRCANYIKDGRFYLDRSVSYLTRNVGQHHYNGGERGFDKVVWTPYVDKSKVIMTYVSDNKEEGYPGQLFVKLTFELCQRNQFRIDYEAYCTEPTIVNLTHLCYFNLAGSTQGPEEIYNHILTLNANCYLIHDDDKIPTGEIKNVVNTIYDFQIPKCLSKVIGIKPNDGYEQSYCVNCGVDDTECFVSRLFHPPSGRMLEIYSSHKGATFSTGNEFGTGAAVPIEELLDQPYTCSTTSLVVGSIYRNVKEILDIDNSQDYFEMRDLIDLVKGVKIGDKGDMDKVKLTKLQREYLEKIKHYCATCEPKLKKCHDLLDAVDYILQHVKTEEEPEEAIEFLADHEIRERIFSQFSAALEGMKEINKKNRTTTKKIHGKGDYLYKAHCGVAVTPGNYPNAINTNGFPNAVLKPGEVYKHTTSYRFWVRAGNPNNWIKRKIYEATYDEKQAAKLREEVKAAGLLNTAIKRN